MRILRPVVLVLAVLLVPFAQGLAQTCQGAGSFANGKMRLGVGATFFDGGKSYGVEGALGTPKSWYARASLGQTSFDGGGDNSTDIGALLGYQIPISDSPVEFCPSAMLSYSTVTGAHVTTWGVGGGIGYRMKSSETLDVVPALGLTWMSTSVSDVPESFTATVLWANVGFVINRQWTLAPGISKSTESGSKAVFNLTLAYNWGK